MSRLYPELKRQLLEAANGEVIEVMLSSTSKLKIDKKRVIYEDVHLTIYELEQMPLNVLKRIATHFEDLIRGVEEEAAIKKERKDARESKRRELEEELAEKLKRNADGED